MIQEASKPSLHSKQEELVDSDDISEEIFEREDLNDEEQVDHAEAAFLKLS